MKRTKLQKNKVVSANLYTKENKKEHNFGLHLRLDINRRKVSHKIKAVNWIIETNPNMFESIKYLLHLKTVLKWIFLICLIKFLITPCKDGRDNLIFFVAWTDFWYCKHKQWPVENLLNSWHSHGLSILSLVWLSVISDSVSPVLYLLPVFPGLKQVRN